MIEDDEAVVEAHRAIRQFEIVDGAARELWFDEILQVVAPVAETAAQRERQVLTLLTDGLSNRRIAQDLFISEKTVSVHISHILAKLGVTNRTEAAATARRINITP